MDHEFTKVKTGDIVILKDFNTLSALGKEFTGQIKEAHTWKNGALTYHGFEVEVEEDITVMLLIKEVGDIVEARIFRLKEAAFANEFTVDLFSFEETEDETNVEDDYENPEEKDEGDCEVGFSDFTIIHDGEEEDGELPYTLKSPYPFWDMKTNDGHTVAICEFFAVGTKDDPIDDDYWAKHAFIEWYSLVGQNGEEGLVSLWFGWDVGLEDFVFLKK